MQGRLFRWCSEWRLTVGHSPMFLMRSMFLILFLAIACPGSVHAQDFPPVGREDAESLARKIEHFDLFFGCSKVAVVVEELDDDMKLLGFSEKAIESAVEVKLRSVKLFSGKLDENLYSPFLYVRLGALTKSDVYSVRVTFRRVVFDRFTDGLGTVETWERGVLAKPISLTDAFSHIAAFVDEFITGYFEANGTFCKDL